MVDLKAIKKIMESVEMDIKAGQISTFLIAAVDSKGAFFFYQEGPSEQVVYAARHIGFLVEHSVFTGMVPMERAKQ